MVSKIIYYGNMSVDCCFDIPSHKIEYYELTFVLKGSMTYYANGEKLVLKKDDAVFLKPGTERRRERGEGHVHYISFNFLLKPEVNLPFDKCRWTPYTASFHLPSSQVQCFCDFQSI